MYQITYNLNKRPVKYNPKINYWKYSTLEKKELENKDDVIPNKTIEELEQN